jgi:GNAT superfamily N-acetyltransferase
MAEMMNPRSIVTNLEAFFASKGLTIVPTEYRFFDGADKVSKKSPPDAYIYHLMENQEIIGTLSIGHTTEYNIQDKDTITLHVRDIDVPEKHRGKGIARAILLYGLCYSMTMQPRIRFSDLEDNTPFANDPARNIYHEFGFRFKEGDPQEKMMDLAVFQQREMLHLYQKVTTTFLQSPSKPKTRSKSKSRSKK